MLSLFSETVITQNKTIYNRYVFYRTQIAVSHIRATVKRNIYSSLSRGTFYTILLVNFQSHSSSRYNLLLGRITVLFGSFNLTERTLPSFGTS